MCKCIVELITIKTINAVKKLTQIHKFYKVGDWSSNIHLNRCYLTIELIIMLQLQHCSNDYFIIVAYDCVERCESALFQNTAADDCQRTPRQTPMKSTTVTGQPLPVHEVSVPLPVHEVIVFRQCVWIDAGYWLFRSVENIPFR